MTENIRVPEGWCQIEVGKTTLYAEPIDGEFVVRYVHIIDYFGGDDMVGVYRIQDGDAKELFTGLGEYENSLDVLQDQLITNIPD